MKKIAAVLLAVILVLSLCACGGGGNENTSVSNKRTVITMNDFVAKAKELGYESTKYTYPTYGNVRQKEEAQFELGSSYIGFILFETPEAAKRWYTNWYNESGDPKKGAKNIEKGSGENWSSLYSENAGGFSYYSLIDDTVVTINGRNMEDKDKALDFVKGLGY